MLEALAKLRMWSTGHLW